MRNPSYTKGTLLEESGKLFNVQGYKATSLRDITNKTGLTKGAIYSHFGSKSKLEIETLQYLVGYMTAQLRARIKDKDTAPKKLEAIFDFYRSYLIKPPIHGGCPLVNASVEADDNNQELRVIAKGITEMLQQSIESIILRGVAYKQFHPEIKASQLATLIMASLEGAILMGKVTKNQKYVDQVIDHLSDIIAKHEIN